MPNGFLIDGHVHCLSMSDEEDRTRTCLIDGHAQVLVMHLNFWDAHMRDGFLIDGHDRPSPQEEPGQSKCKPILVVRDTRCLHDGHSRPIKEAIQARFPKGDFSWLTQTTCALMELAGYVETGSRGSFASGRASKPFVAT